MMFHYYTSASASRLCSVDVKSHTLNTGLNVVDIMHELKYQLNLNVTWQTVQWLNVKVQSSLPGTRGHSILKKKNKFLGSS